VEQWCLLEHRNDQAAGWTTLEPGFESQKRQESVLHSVQACCIPEDKAAGTWSWPSPASSAEINIWSHTSTPPCVFVKWCLVKLINSLSFLFLLWKILSRSCRLLGLWGVTPFSLVHVYRYFGGKYCLNHQCGRVSQSSREPIDENNMFLRNVSEFLPDFMASHLRTLLLFIVIAVRTWDAEDLCNLLKSADVSEYHVSIFMAE
jgi:hypothetical protein